MFSTRRLDGPGIKPALSDGLEPRINDYCTVCQAQHSSRCLISRTTTRKGMQSSRLMHCWKWFISGLSISIIRTFIAVLEKFRLGGGNKALPNGRRDSHLKQTI